MVYAALILADNSYHSDTSWHCLCGQLLVLHSTSISAHWMIIEFYPDLHYMSDLVFRILSQ